MMKTLKLPAIALLALVSLLINGAAFAQSPMVTTTLSTAVTTSQTAITVASASSINAASRPISVSEIGAPTSASFTLLFVDKEAMAVNSITGTVAQVIRGWNGTLQTPHVSGAKVWVAPSYAYGNYDPAGACQLATVPYLPRVVPTTGNIWTCGNGSWVTFGTFVGKLSAGAAISSATTIAPTNPFFHVTGTTNVVNITVPPACPGVCQLVIIPDGVFATTNAGNIALATTAVVSKALIMTYDPGTSKWYPSY